MPVSNKIIQVSDDNGSTWFDLPGNTGSFQDTAGSVDDTVFGQPYKSMQPTVIDTKITANAFFKGFAGYVANLKQSGSSTVTTGEATTLVSTRVYQITNAVKRVFDRTVTPVVKDGGVDQTANVLSIDYLFGIVTFKGSYTVSGAITVDYNYLPMSSIVKANAFTLTQTAEVVDQSDFITLQGNSGHKVFIQGLKTVDLEVKGFYDHTNDLEALLDGRAEIVIEINPDGSEESVARGFFRPSDLQYSGNVGALEASSLKFSLTVPDDTLMAQPFGWMHTSSPIPVALQKALTAWQTGNYLAVQYLADGTHGFTALDTIVSNMTLTGGLEVMNTYAANFQVSGTITEI